MFNKPGSDTSSQAKPGAPAPAPLKADSPPPAPQLQTPSIVAPPRPKGVTVIAADMTLEGDIAGGGEIQIDGFIKGDVRVDHVIIDDGGRVEGGIFAEQVEIRGKVSGSITAKQVRLYGACQVTADITHEQLAMETGAVFEGRSLRMQRPAQGAPVAAQPRAASAVQ